LGRKLLGNDHPQFRSAFSGFKSCLEQQNKFQEVADLWREQIDLMRSEMPVDDPRLAEVLDRLVLALLEQRKFIQAEFPARECLAIRQKKLPDDPLTFRMHGLLGLSLFGQRKYREAEPLLLSGYQGMRDREARLSSQGKRNLKTALQYLVQFYEATDQTAQAKEWRKKLEETERNLTEKLPPPSPVADNGSASNRE
jgi:hypothetical protein